MSTKLRCPHTFLDAVASQVLAPVTDLQADGNACFTAFNKHLAFFFNDYILKTFIKSATHQVMLDA